MGEKKKRKKNPIINDTPIEAFLIIAPCKPNFFPPGGGGRYYDISDMFEEACDRPKSQKTIRKS